MESVGNVIYDVLHDDPVIDGLVGNSLYQGLISQKDRSTTQIRYFTIGVEPNDTKDGVSTLDTHTIRVDIFSKRQRTCQTVAARVRALLDRLPHGLYGGIMTQGVRFVSGDMLPESADATDRYLFTLVFDIRVDRLKSVLMNYSLTEQSTGETWIDGSAIYERTWNLGDGQTGWIPNTYNELTGLDATYRIIDFLPIVDHTMTLSTEVSAAGMQTTGGDDWGIFIQNGAISSSANLYVWVRYVKGDLT